MMAPGRVVTPAMVHDAPDQTTPAGFPPYRVFGVQRDRRAREGFRQLCRCHSLPPPGVDVSEFRPPVCWHTRVSRISNKQYTVPFLSARGRPSPPSRVSRPICPFTSVAPPSVGAGDMVY